MGKSKKKRNRTKALYAAAVAAKRRMLLEKEDTNGVVDDASIDTEEEEEEGTERAGTSALSQPPQGEPSSSDIATTLRTIQHLAKFPDLFLHSKEYKELRGALHPLVTERLKSYDKGIDYRQRVTVHLSHQRWSAALSSLAAAKDFQQLPKQGTVQRWVRDVDQCEDGPVKIQLLTSVLSCNANTNHSNGDGGNGTYPAKHNGDDDDESDERDTDDGMNKHDPALALIEAQKSYNKMKTGSNNTGTGKGADTNTELTVLEGWRISPSSSSPNNEHDDSDVEDLQTLESRIVYRETASERTPPNRYDLLLHATAPSAVLPLRERNVSPEVSKHEVPFLTGAFVLENVLSHDECSRLIRAASILGYRPDHPSNLPAPTGIDSCEWLVDDSVHDLVYTRVKEYLSPSVGLATNGNGNGNGNASNGGSKKSNALCGINKRWRFFRYGPDCVYRPHIDGSWPAGSLSENGKSYELDKSGSTRSYLTFLIYLNDGFEGGETRFYYPEGGAKSLVVRGIVPHKGSVLVFPQGNTASLLHEGSAVTKGTKYVIRTDVLYRH